jgi:hypothetical protein
MRFDTFRGWEIVDNTARLCDMNLLLHWLGGPDAPSPVTVDDALRSDPGDRFDMVLTNPPFGKKSSVTVASAEGELQRETLTIVRDDFEQAAQLPPAREDTAEDRRPGRNRRTGQRAVRGWCRRFCIGAGQRQP